MNLFKKIANWWEKNQERGSERYLEREELKEDLKEYSKDIEAIYNSPAMDFQQRTLERASLIQNIHMQRKLTQATDGLKTATWVLALATIVFAWVAIKDSPNSSEIMQILQNVLNVVVGIFIFVIVIPIIWNIGKFIIKWARKLVK
jgi:hypothetical protein